MKIKEIACALSAALLLIQSTAALAEAPPIQTDIQQVPYPMEAHPNADEVAFSTSIQSTASLTWTVFPFVDEAGRSWKLKVYFSTSQYDLLNSAGVVVSVGYLSADQLGILKHAAYELRRKKKDPSYSYIQPVWLIPTIEIGLALVGLYLAYHWQEENNQQYEALSNELEHMCLSKVASDTNAAYAHAASACPARSWAQSDGRICHNQPIYEHANVAGCEGQHYARCDTVCN